MLTIDISHLPVESELELHCALGVLGQKENHRKSDGVYQPRYTPSVGLTIPSTA